MPIPHITVRFGRIEQDDSGLERHAERGAQLGHAREGGYFGPRGLRTRRGATACQPGSRQVIHASDDGYRLVRLERDTGQSIAQTGKRYPAAINQGDPSVRTLQRGQYLKPGAPLVTAIVEQKLAARVQVPDHADSLK